MIDPFDVVTTFVAPLMAGVRANAATATSNTCD